PAGTSTKPIPIEIQSGESPQAIAEDLQNKGLIRSAFAFLIWARIQGVDQKFQAGLYKGLSPSMTIQQITQLLQDGQPDAIPYTIVEGYRIEQIADVLGDGKLVKFNKDDFLNYAEHPDHFLAQFPDPTTGHLL